MNHLSTTRRFLLYHQQCQSNNHLQATSRCYRRTPPDSVCSLSTKALNLAIVRHRRPTPTIYPSDLIVGSGAEKCGLIMKCWTSKAVKQALGQAKFIFDGNKLAWSDVPITREQRIQVDLDAEENRTVKPGDKENKHRVVIRQTNQVDGAFMAGRCGFTNAVLEAINVFDHLLRICHRRSPPRSSGRYSCVNPGFAPISAA